MSFDNRIWTLSGKSFDLFTPPQEFSKYKKSFNINDITTGLSNICRWGGQTSFFYSVAQHCCLVAELCQKTEPQYTYWGLMHDAPETYIGDMQRPLKYNFDQYLKVEDLLEKEFFPVIGLQGKIPPYVKFIDSCLAYREAETFGLKVFHDPQYEVFVNEARTFLHSHDILKDIDPWSQQETRHKYKQIFNLCKPSSLHISENGDITTKKIKPKM